MIALVLLLAALRIYELTFNGLAHGGPHPFFSILVFGWANDILWLSLLSPFLLLLYVLLYLFSKKAAAILFTVIGILLGLIQISLIQYFSTTLAPLGGDLWGYSMNDIHQTMGAAGGVPVSAIIAFLLFVGLGLFLLWRVPQKVHIRLLFALPLLILLLLLAWTGPQQLSPGFTDSEYKNNLTLNKLQFFTNSSFHHFFPSFADLDIYADSYSGDYESEAKAGAKAVVFQYVDETNYPFLHTAQAPDVLSSFLDLDTQKPNIVILLVEGLGRAFACSGGYLGNFTPFLDSLSGQSLYWENCMSEGGRTFAVLPSVIGSLPFAKNGFCALAENQPNHLSLLSLLKHNGYQTAFYYGGDAHFDLMDTYLKHDAIGKINDIQSFPSGYVKMPTSSSGFTWGYGDKELFRHYFETLSGSTQPYLNVMLTVSTHNPFLINEEDTYLGRFESRMNELKFDDDRKQEARNYKNQFASILYTDDALRGFFAAYSKRPDFHNTIFLITGDHRMPEIPMANKIDRYHVPLIIYSPLLRRTAKFSSISTHFDITPSLLAMLKAKYAIDLPSLVTWMGTGLDTTRAFQNVHDYPFMQTKNDIVDFINATDMLNQNSVFMIGPDMGLTPDNDQPVLSRLGSLFDQFKQRNNKMLSTGKLMPDSLYERYFPK